MLYFTMWTLFWAVVGSFGTAYIHERTGREVSMGGILGLLVGAVGGIFLLTLFWLWLWYGNHPTPVGKAYNLRRRWYRWWE